MVGLLRGVQLRIEASCRRHGLTYPWWIPAYSTLALISMDIAAFVQRGVTHPHLTSIIAAVVIVVPALAWTFSSVLLAPWVEGVGVAASVSLYLLQPVKPDFAPFLLLISAGEVAATSPVVVAFVMTGIHFVVLSVALANGHLQSAPLYYIGVVLGADVGIAMRWQMRALAAERANNVVVGERAMLAERQRVAREVHDVVGHALSINLLHVTAARHALQEYGDVADAVESLTEAERVGRSAMGDLRRTVAVLGSGGGETHVLPGLADVPTLIERVRAAGLDVAVDSPGTALDTQLVGNVAGLGVYRIVQESLANIAKHAPTSAARVCIETDDRAVHITVRNTLPAGIVTATVGGSGLPGMAARAEQMGARLDAGPRDGHWVVDLVVPLGQPDPAEAPAPVPT